MAAAKLTACEPLDALVTSPATLLAIETATETMSVGVAVGDRVLSEESAGGAQASARLLPVVLNLLEAAGGLRVQDLDAIAFGRGPGAFTGLRTACSVTQGLAFGAGRPVLPVDTLLVVAEAARAADAGHEVWAALDARMDEIYAARYRFDGLDWHTVHPPALYSAEALSQRLACEGGDCVAGNALLVHGLQVGTMNTLPHAGPHAGALIELGRAAWRRGEALDPALALPLYIREKIALTTAERDALKLAKEAA
nr:tRNA (adenosine(37)-N6)-threonylcarbamoyltransferase complex dimerization subunit type 1 TsaB [Caldimonas mangrovi]